ncbi:four helix bundle protein [Patescibacteria group bacterium]|nr:four helix bundle protein [Patescibacteria group bacterium]
MKITKFEELNIWKQALSITKLIYDFTSKKEFSRDFGLRDQIRRAVVSISSNIVEGFEKNNNNEFIRFLKIAKGSAGECRNQLHIALAVNHITSQEFAKANNDLESLAKQIGAFISYLETKRKNKEFIPTR